jgi:hypothetical protein
MLVFTLATLLASVEFVFAQSHYPRRADDPYGGLVYRCKRCGGIAGKPPTIPKSCPHCGTGSLMLDEEHTAGVATALVLVTGCLGVPLLLICVAGTAAIIHFKKANLKKKARQAYLPKGYGGRPYQGSGYGGQPRPPRSHL